MNSHLIKQISSDLNINKYENETDEEYGNRLIYSAVVAWARVLVLGKSYTDLNDEIECSEVTYHNVDIMHIQAKLKQIMYGILRVIPHSKDWFGKSVIEEQCSIFSSNIIDNLILCYELSQLNDVRRLTYSPIRNANFKNNQLILGGTQWKEVNKEMVFIGIGRWVPVSHTPQNYKEVFNLPKYSANEYYNNLVNSAFWKESELKGKYKIFRMGTGLFYKQCWNDFTVSKLKQGVSLLKNIEVDGGYILVKMDKNEVTTARLDKWYYEEKEIYRIMYVLDSHNNTPAVFKVKIYDDYVLLHCHSSLPNSEMRILLMSSWPKRYYNDIYYRVIPIFIWSEVKTLLINLGIKIECY